MILPESGTVEIIAGPMGSGKSLHCVGRVLEIIEQERRPVFTNLPVKLRVFRKYLSVKSGPAYASLIYALSEEHFNRFIERQHKRMELRKRLEDKWAHRGRPAMHGRVLRIFERIHGPSIYQGPDANDIYETSIVLIDEAHHWFPMQGGKPIDEKLQSYITMCRHHMHCVILVSQAPMQLAKCSRRLCSIYSICRNKAQDRLMWGIRFKHLGIKALGIETYRGEDVKDGEPVKFAEPMTSKALLLAAPSVRVLFRLYSSFTHLGSPRRMLNRLAEVRATHGILEEDNRVRELRRQAKRARPMKIGKIASKLLLRASIAGVFVVLGVGIGRGLAPPAPVEEIAAAGWAPPEGLKVKARAGDRIAIGDAWYGKGDNFHGAKVRVVAADGVLVERGGVFYAYGREGLRELGPADQLVPLSPRPALSRSE